MLFATIGQWKVLVAMMVAGLLVGLVYDLLAALRRLLPRGTLLSLCADLAFGLMSALVLGGALTFANYGQMRLFAFLGAGAGAALYALGAAPPRARAFARHCAANFDEYGVASSNFVYLKSSFVKGKRLRCRIINNTFEQGGLAGCTQGRYAPGSGCC